MPHTIGPFPTIHGGRAFPGHLSSEDATPLEPIHKRLRANISIHPDQVEHLVCRAVQQCYDMLKRIHARRGSLNKYVLEEALPERAFHIALECGWLPEGARTDSPAWRGWIRQLLEGRFSRVGLEESCKPDPYLSVPFPVVASGGKAFVVTAAAGGEKRTKPGPKRDVQTALKVKGVVERVAGGKPWKSELDAVCTALDEGQISRPKPWRNRKPPIVDWVDAAVSERELAIKAIGHHLKNARQS